MFDEKELYIFAGKQLGAIQDFVQALRRLEYTVKEVATGADAMQVASDRGCHLLICLEPEMDPAELRNIAQRAEVAGAFLYIIGNPEVILPNKASFLEKVPGAHFAGLPLDYNLLTEAIGCNSRAKKRVLVVDDEAIMLRSVKVWLGEDFEVSLVNSGETAIDFLTKHPVDLVLLDYRMPGMTGPDVLKALRQNELTKRIPVIFLTGKNDKESIMQVVALKPNGYILKTKKPEEIKAAVVDFFKTRVWSF